MTGSTRQTVVGLFHQTLHDAGAVYYVMDGKLEGDPDELLLARLVTSWCTTKEDVAQFLATANADS